MVVYFGLIILHEPNKREGDGTSSDSLSMSTYLTAASSSSDGRLPTPIYRTFCNPPRRTRCFSTPSSPPATRSMQRPVSAPTPLSPPSTILRQGLLRSLGDGDNHDFNKMMSGLVVPKEQTVEVVQCSRSGSESYNPNTIHCNMVFHALDHVDLHL